MARVYGIIAGVFFNDNFTYSEMNTGAVDTAVIVNESWRQKSQNMYMSPVVNTIIDGSLWQKYNLSYSTASPRNKKEPINSSMLVIHFFPRYYMKIILLETILGLTHY